MRAGFIGAGKVGFSLGRYFRERGAAVAGYYSRTPESAAEAAAFTGTRAYEGMGQLLSDCDVLFLTVPDGQIAPVWRELETLPLDGTLVCHCSGALSSAVFEGIARTGAFGYAVHPFFAVHSRLESYREVSGAFFTVEGDPGRREALCGFLERMGNPVHVISADQKVKYHAAAVFLSNHVAALAHTGCSLLAACGLTPEIASRALATLFLSNCGGVAAKGPVAALTGPVERGDAETVRKHLDCLEGEDRLLYLLLSRRLTRIAQEKHPDRDYAAVEALLEDGFPVLPGGAADPPGQADPIIAEMRETD